MGLLGEVLSQENHAIIKGLRDYSVMYFQLFFQYFVVYIGILRKMGILTLAMKYIYAFHLVYVLLINNHLREFTTGWENHPLSTERNRSPNQLLVLGQIDYHVMFLKISLN